MSDNRSKKRPNENQVKLLVADFNESNEMIRHIENERWKITEFYFVIMIGLFTIISALGKDFSEIAEQIGQALGVLLCLSTFIILFMFAKLRIEFVERIENLTKTRQAFRLLEEWNIYVGKKLPDYAKLHSVHMMCNLLLIVTTSIVGGALLGQAWKQGITTSLAEIILILLLLLAWLAVLSFWPRFAEWRKARPI